MGKRLLAVLLVLLAAGCGGSASSTGLTVTGPSGRVLVLARGVGAPLRVSKGAIVIDPRQLVECSDQQHGGEDPAAAVVLCQAISGPSGGPDSYVEAQLSGKMVLVGHGTKQLGIVAPPSRAIRNVVRRQPSGTALHPFPNLPLGGAAGIQRNIKLGQVVRFGGTAVECKARYRMIVCFVNPGHGAWAPEKGTYGLVMSRRRIEIVRFGRWDLIPVFNRSTH